LPGGAVLLQAQQSFVLPAWLEATGKHALPHWIVLFFGKADFVFA